MNKYYIKDEKGSFWCESRMKPTNAEDKPKNYHKFGYWSDYNSSLRFRINRILICMLPLYLIMRLTGVKCKLKKID